MKNAKDSGMHSTYLNPFDLADVEAMTMSETVPSMACFKFEESTSKIQNRSHLVFDC